MIRKVFLDKCSSIFRDSEDNFGLNPVVMLNEGNEDSKALLQFSFDNIREVLEESDFGNNTISYRLHMYNCGSLDKRHFGQQLGKYFEGDDKVRATGFDVVLFKVPQKWDRGVGFDSSTDIWTTGESCVSTLAVNWYQASDGVLWDTEGIITDNELLVEYDKFMSHEESIIVGTQHFPIGVEDLSIDITSYVEDVMNNRIPDRGLCLAFLPSYYNTQKTRYVGFFSDKTRTFYEPYVEVKSDFCIKDNRENFILGKKNRLYLYFYTQTPHPDYMPVCTIDGISYPVTKASNSVYYAEVRLDTDKYSDEQELSDVWSNITFDGEEFDTYENYFFVKRVPFFGSKAIVNSSEQFMVLSGIKEDEKLTREEIRNIKVTLKAPYTGIEKKPSEDMWYSLHVSDSYRDVYVTDWDSINITPDCNYFTIYTKDLLPNIYHIDIKIGKRIYRNQLEFKIVDKKTTAFE